LDENDAESFRALRLRALQESPEAFGSSYEETAAQSLASMARRLRTDPEAPHDFYLGAFDPAIIGMIGFQRETRRKTQHTGTIRSLYVAAHARGRGVGHALLERGIAEARLQPGLEQLFLAVVSTNEAARRLYAAHGFTVYGVEPHALKLDDRYYDEDLMVLRLR
jgi:RimJ/RimL family protein N-acetyltransferase